VNWLQYALLKGGFTPQQLGMAEQIPAPVKKRNYSHQATENLMHREALAIVVAQECKSQITPAEAVVAGEVERQAIRSAARRAPEPPRPAPPVIANAAELVRDFVDTLPVAGPPVYQAPLDDDGIRWRSIVVKPDPPRKSAQMELFSDPEIRRVK